ncbi:MAG: TolC family outer membrane protein [Sphingomonadaceae bacterium]|uniref:TolC family outer membrane protein n=1 Tax=Thermaurantiacus sp. TaxID=2820283 RepID=UPI00298F3783|nr:TolC family outer membrane protein [Thermaurantiacus sp.]MCS6986612.1 TolC family outer membrane protein [Sphingomonadaceae bacterium]MDW8414127.1 TolC family outer membrane protein [Thermaurantiacus sp.]
MRCRFAIAALAVAGIAQPVAAESLPEVLAAAYATNPELAAARAAVRRLDDQLPIVRSGMRPSVNGSINFSQELDENLDDFGRRTTAGVRITQPVWAGGRVQAGIRAVDAQIGAARERLRALENRIIADAVQAYADVLATRAEVELNRNQVRVLERQLQASTDRFEVGDLTRTDVAQSQARLEGARANLVVAEGNARRAEEAFRRVVGRLPGRLDPLPELPPLPASVEEARDIALANSPDLLAARYDEKAADEQVTVAKRERFGEANVNSTFAYQAIRGGPLAPFLIDGLTATIGVNMSIPIFTSGLVAARVRQAQAAQSEALERIEGTARAVTEATINAWTVLKAAESFIRSTRVAIDANELAAEGVRQENLVGNRDILDVLNAEQELLSSRVALVRAERDRYVAAYRLLQAMGMALARADLPPDGRHDPDRHFRRVDRTWREFRADPDPRESRQRDRPPAAPAPEPLPGPPPSIRDRERAE